MPAPVTQPDIITQGFGTPNKIVTQGFMSGASPPPPPAPLGTGGVVVTYIPLNAK